MIGPALYEVQQREKMEIVGSTLWSKERDNAVKKSKQNYPTFDEDNDFLCLLFAHKFQALSKVPLQIVLLYALSVIHDFLFLQVLYPDVEFSTHSFCHEYNKEYSRVDGSYKKTVGNSFTVKFRDHFVKKFSVLSPEEQALLLAALH